MARITSLTPPRDAIDEWRERQPFRPHSVERGEPAAENVITTAKAPGSLEGADVARHLNDTENSPVASWVAADLAEFAVAVIETLATRANPIGDGSQSLGQGDRVVPVAQEQEVRDPFRSSGRFRELGQSSSSPPRLRSFRHRYTPSPALPIPNRKCH